jgi:hypothetical protein
VERQARSLGLRLEQRAADGVHRYAIEFPVDGGQQCRNAAGILLPQCVERPRGVLPGRPTDGDLHNGADDAGKAGMVAHHRADREMRPSCPDPIGKSHRNWQLETGNWKLETGNSLLSYVVDNLGIIVDDLGIWRIATV